MKELNVAAQIKRHDSEFKKERKKDKYQVQMPTFSTKVVEHQSI